jgi:hypothetical protein
VGLPDASKRLAIVLVAAVDRRVLPALALAPQLADCEVRAVHVAIDPDDSLRLARDWMDLGISWPPLHIEEPTADTLQACVRDLVEREAAARPHVTVLVPELDLNRWWQPLLHRGTGRAVAWMLHDLVNVTTAVLPVRVDLRPAAPAAVARLIL